MRNPRALREPVGDLPTKAHPAPPADATETISWER